MPLFNKLLTRLSREDVKCLYESIYLKFIPVLLKLVIEKVKNVSILCPMQLTKTLICNFHS